MSHDFLVQTYGQLLAVFKDLMDTHRLERHSFELLPLFESTLYLAAMQATNGSQKEAAKLLGVARGTLRTKLKSYYGTTRVGGRYHAIAELPEFAKSQITEEASSKKQWSEEFLKEYAAYQAATKQVQQLKKLERYRRTVCD